MNKVNFNQLENAIKSDYNNKKKSNPTVWPCDIVAGEKGGGVRIEKIVHADLFLPPPLSLLGKLARRNFCAATFDWRLFHVGRYL